MFEFSSSFFCAAVPPLVVLVEGVESRVVSHEERLAARLGQHIGIVEVTHKAHEVRVAPCILQVVVDAAAQPVRLLLVEHIVLVTSRQRKQQRRPTESPFGKPGGAHPAAWLPV